MSRPKKEIFYRKDRDAYYFRYHLEDVLIIRKLANAKDVDFKVTLQGKRRRSATEKDNLLDSLAEKIRQSVRSGTVSVNNARLSDYLELWINQLTVQTEKARREYRASVLKFIEIVGDLPLRSLKNSSSRKFIQVLDQQGLSRNSIRSYLRMTNIYLNYLAKEECIPKINLDSVAQEQRNVGVYSSEDLDYIQTVMENRSRNGLRMVMMLRYLGLRASEVRTLPLRHLSPHQVAIRRVPELGWQPKKGKEDTLLVPKPLEQFLKQDLAQRQTTEMYYLDSGTGSPAFCDVSAMTKLVRPVVQELGLKGIVKPLHGYRASLVTSLMRAKVPLPVISEICRHSDIKTTRGYARVDKLDMKQALESIGY